MGFPKQFLCLAGNESLFQQAAQCLVNLGNADIQVANPTIISGKDQRFMVFEQLRESGIELGSAFLEPVGPNTALAITLAAFTASEQGAEPVLVVTSAEETVTHPAALAAAMQHAALETYTGTIVFIGVKSTHPETGYGYIQCGYDSLAAHDLIVAPKPVHHFVEKPNAETAQLYLDEDNYFWNAGMFLPKASVWSKALNQFRPDNLEVTQAAWVKRSADGKFIRPGKTGFGTIPSESVDCAAIEHCPGSSFPIKMIPLDAGWNDLSARDAVWNSLPKDDKGNAHIGDVLIANSKNTLAHATSRLVSLVGVENLIVVETPHAVLVANKNCSQDVKHIVTQLQKTQREEHALLRKVHRPWRWFDSIDEGGYFKVKRLHAKPKASLSLQKHHRAEHWIMVKGIVEITNGDKVLTLTENQSTYIPLGEVCRLANPGTTPLETIELQSGSYLGEDDIVRFQDTYGRH